MWDDYEPEDMADWLLGPDEPPPAPPEELGRCVTTPGCTGRVWRDRELPHLMWCTAGCFDDLDREHEPEQPEERYEGGMVLLGTIEPPLRWLAHVGVQVERRHAVHAGEL